jgi:hypothetical protein
MDEQWKGIAGHHGYEVSTLGRVRSVARRIVTSNDISKIYSGRILCQATDGHGYQRVCFWRGNRQMGAIVHRLVAAAFLRPIERGEEVNHIDHDKRNNAVKNLEIISRTANMAHASAAGRMAKKLTEQQVREIKYSLLWGETKQALRVRFDVSRELISAIACNKVWRHVDQLSWLATHD